jgi:hypothetical protein
MKSRKNIRHSKYNKKGTLRRGGQEGWKEYRDSNDIGELDIDNVSPPLEEPDMEMREAESDFDSYNETQLQSKYDKLVDQYKRNCNINNKFTPYCVYLTQKVNKAFFKLQKAKGNDIQKISWMNRFKRKLTQRKQPDNYGGRKTRCRKSRKSRK